MKKLNIGCGDKKLDGYINIDNREDVQPDLVHDIVNPLPYEDNSIDEVCSRHVLEHFNRVAGVAILKDWYRVLKPTGKVAITVPNITFHAKQLLGQVTSGFPDEIRHAMAGLYGWAPGHEEANQHFYGYTEVALTSILKAIGFKSVEKAEKNIQPWHLSIIAHKNKRVMSLDELALKYGSDKSSHWHDYMVEYEKYLKPLRRSARVVLELGIGKGISMQIWADYFDKATVNGIDTSPECKDYEGDRKKVFIGKQEDTVFLNKVCNEIGTLDIVIDDCSHRVDCQIASLGFLYYKLKQGGIYVIEAVKCKERDLLERKAKEIGAVVESVYKYKLRDESLLILRKSDDNHEELQKNHEALGARKVKVKVIGGAFNNIDYFMISGKEKNVREPFELTQSQDVRSWCANPDNICDIQSHLLTLKKIVGPLDGKIKILDVGCYGGYVYDFLKQKTTFFKNEASYYIGIDIQESAIEAAKAVHKEKEKEDALFFTGDIFDLTKIYSPRNFDVVCCYRVLIHLPYFKRALENLVYVADKFVHVVLHIQDEDVCRRCEETDLITGKKVIYYHRYISEKTIKEALSGLPVTYTIIPAPGNAYASLIIERK